MSGDPLHRKHLEYRLSALLRTAEETTLSSPEVKSMVDKLRNAYQDDQGSFMYMMGMSGAPPAPKKHALPPSRIPQLLMMLDSLATGKPVSLPPSMSELKNGETPSLLSSANGSTSNGTASGAPGSTKPLPQKQQPLTVVAPVNVKMLQEINEEIRNTKSVLAQMRKEETLIRSRKGKYSISVERLKAERILREYPEMINHLEHKKQMIEQGIL